MIFVSAYLYFDLLHWATSGDTVFIVLDVMTGLVDTFYFRSIYLNLATMGCRKGDDTSTPNAGAILNLSRGPQ